eukprot:3597473-Rhodomonas_salina.2
MLLRFYYAKSGTELAYAAMQCGVLSPGMLLLCYCMVLCVYYAICGTELAYAATQCRVLSYGMAPTEHDGRRVGVPSRTSVSSYTPQYRRYAKKNCPPTLYAVSCYGMLLHSIVLIFRMLLRADCPIRLATLYRHLRPSPGNNVLYLPTLLLCGTEPPYCTTHLSTAPYSSSVG